MKPFLLLAIGLWVNLHAQTQSQDWIDLSNRSDAEIISTLEKAVAALAESPAEEASNRVYILQMQEKTARQSFDQKTILLEGELAAAAAAKEAAEKAFSDLQTDSTALSAKLDLYARSQQRLRERLDKFPFKAVMLAKAIYTGNLEPVKEKMIFEAGCLAIKEVNGMQIISETLAKNNILVSDIIEATTAGRTDCQPREWKTLVKGTAERVICLYGIYDIYPLVEPIKLSAQAAQLQLPIATYFIRSPNDPSLLSLPPSIQEEIRTMLIAAERANVEVRNNLNMLVQQEMQVLRSSGVTDSKDLLKSKSDALKRQMDSKRLDLFANRQAYASARKKFWDHLNSEQRIEIVTQSDLERNRSQDVIKTKLMRECLIQFRTTAKSLFSQENSRVVNFQLVENSSKSMFRQVQLQAVKVLGIYLSPSEGDIKYTAAVAFRFGFEYASPTKVADNVATNVPKIDLSFLPDQPTTNATTKILRPNPLLRLRSYPTTLSVEQVTTMVRQYGFYDRDYNPQGKGINHEFTIQQGGKAVFDRTTGLMWQQSGSSSEYMTYADAENYIQDLNDKRFASYNDWRLPTLEEAMSLMESLTLNTDLHINPRFNERQRFIWTADKGNASQAWFVSFSVGSCGLFDVNYYYYVRAVRSVR